MDGFSDILTDLFEAFTPHLVNYEEPGGEWAHDVMATITYLLRNLSYLRWNKARILGRNDSIQYLLSALVHPSVQVRRLSYMLFIVVFRRKTCTVYEDYVGVGSPRA